MNSDGTFGASTRAWSFVTAQTDVKLLDVPSTQFAIVTFAKAICARSNTGNVSVRIGFGATALPTLTDDSATGVLGEILSSGGIAPGGGEVNSNGGVPIARGADGEDVYLTCSAATGGNVRIILQYRLVDVGV